ncbi:uncharacterized protein C8A04DRAFT_23810 [Dichotomopilus funicola]|uniref:Uncharacterized protein n=1 Tax=Dichotomopilus funicola TaxID=1934379 RepID=A0AAN6VAR6_9PEZI|nr:hypothetical protein C8A04DRAFT_23810 [Dichotomopilus funicola]
MRRSIDIFGSEQPWIKRLRTTKSRSPKAGDQRLFDLPSPKPTNPSSTENIPSSSSPAGHRASLERQSLKFLRERLVPRLKKPAPPSVVEIVANTNKQPAKPSVAPFFQRTKAAFSDEPALNTKKTAKTNSPSQRHPVDADDLIQQLKEHYLQTATSLHQSAIIRLDQTHADLSRKLTQAVTKADDAFLEATESHITKLAEPLSVFRIRSQQRSADGSLRTRDDAVGDLVARAEAQVREFERDMGRLWEEWMVMEREAKELVGEVVAAVSRGSGAGKIRGTDETGDVLSRFREAIVGEIDAAEEGVADLGEEALCAMKEIEKNFRKATLPDLHTFFQSIDEP